MTTFTQITNIHLTNIDKKIIKTSIENNNQNAGTKFKKLQIVSIENNIVNAILHSFEMGIGIDSNKSWHKRNLTYSINNK